ncbi:MAG: DUF444 family protein [Hydrogenibacillus schlegelii]|uniref:DUF444 family protein n=1 Tax=Hydrogenibacillus schlegelii TaxID=1484 RepID=A0A947CYW9_HYDSH|nr:DUF444 family protein [Hydrogenibacillus schlegelii]
MLRGENPGTSSPAEIPAPPAGRAAPATRRTLLNALRRAQKAKAFGGRAALAGPLAIRPDDLRFRAWGEDVEEEARAVVLAMTSMGPYEKYMTIVFFFWMTRFLKRSTPALRLAQLKFIEERNRGNARFVRL